MHLNLDMWLKPGGKHPQMLMQELSITYQHSTPQSISDSWWFWNCQNVPDPLPPYLTELRVRPRDAIGNGLSKELADAIVAAEPQGEAK